MKLIKKRLKIILISINIALVCGAFGILFNVINPFGIEIKEKPKTVQAVRIIKINKIQKKSVKTNIKNPASQVTPEIVRQVPATSEVQKTIKQAKEVVINNIDLIKAKELFDNEKAVFVDARPEFRYLESHVKGALSLSASQFIRQYEIFKDKVTKDTPLVIYCSSKRCDLSEIVAENLKEKGYTQLMVFSGGWDEWASANYPVEGLKDE